jgi:hypothetical protein
MVVFPSYTRCVRLGLRIFVIAAILTGTATAWGQPPRFLEVRHSLIINLLRQPPTAARDAQIAHEVDQLIDYSTMAHACFLEQDWTRLTPQQRTDVTKPVIDTPPPRPDGSMFATASTLVTNGDLGGARAVLEPRVFGPGDKATPPEVNLLRGICKTQHDAMCITAISQHYPADH